jgi:hypothetical protein
MNKGRFSKIFVQVQVKLHFSDGYIIVLIDYCRGYALPDGLWGFAGKAISAEVKITVCVSTVLNLATLRIKVLLLVPQADSVIGWGTERKRIGSTGRFFNGWKDENQALGI